MDHGEEQADKIFTRKKIRRRAIESFVVAAALMAFVGLTSYFGDVLRTGDWRTDINLGDLTILPTAAIAILIAALVIFLLSFLWPNAFKFLMSMLGRQPEK